MKQRFKWEEIRMLNTNYIKQIIKTNTSVFYLKRSTWNVVQDRSLKKACDRSQKIKLLLAL